MLEFRDWTLLHTLNLSNATITQIIVTLTILVLNWEKDDPVAVLSLVAANWPYSLKAFSNFDSNML